MKDKKIKSKGKNFISLSEDGESGGEEIVITEIKLNDKLIQSVRKIKDFSEKTKELLNKYSINYKIV